MSRTNDLSILILSTEAAQVVERGISGPELSMEIVRRSGATDAASQRLRMVPSSRIRDLDLHPVCRNPRRERAKDKCTNSRYGMDRRRLTATACRSQLDGGRKRCATPIRRAVIRPVSSPSDELVGAISPCWG